MKALVFSDSHGDLSALQKIVKKERDIEAIFHLGDVESDEERMRWITPHPVYMVRGNCDYCSTLPEQLTVDFAGKRIALCHGHRYFSYHEGVDLLLYLGKQEKADVVMFGHTHVPFLEEREGITLLNPGSISRPRQENKIPTYTVMEVGADGKLSFQMCQIDWQ